MNFKAFVVVALSACGTLVSQAQSNNSVLFTLDGKPYYSEEFKRIYSKNLDLIKDNAQRDIDQYLDLYILYKLKVAKAYELKLDTESAYVEELKSNRDQLAERYLTDEKITDELVVEAYKRSQKEINASHILLSIRSFAEATDTLKAYNKAIHLRNEILAGADFEEMAKKHSDDTSAKENGGALGYFSAFRMVYPFESAAYNTAVGAVSMPVRTQFGYHLIKVNEIRDFRGEVTVAHLMLLKSKDDDATQDKITLDKINEIAADLKNGANFEEMVRRYSQDVNTAKNDGVLQKFTAGTMNARAFEDAAFNLNTPGDISQPVETAFGWHLIKLIQKHPLPSFEESKSDMLVKVKRDSRSRVINNQLIETIKARYAIVEDKKYKKQITALIQPSFYDQKWTIPSAANQYEKALITIDNEKVSSAMDFLKFVEANQSTYRAVKPLSQAVELLYNSFFEKQLRNYYLANLEKEFPEFDYTVKEYREGLLLFDLMEREIWNKVQTDTLGYTAYYENNKEHYRKKQRIEITTYDFKDAKAANRFLKSWKKQADLAVQIKGITGVFDADSPEVLEMGIPLVKGIYRNSAKKEQLVLVKEVLPEEIPELDQLRSLVIQQYQEDFEKAWIRDLKSQKEIHINQEVLEETKRELIK